MCAYTARWAFTKVMHWGPNDWGGRNITISQSLQPHSCATTLRSTFVRSDHISHHYLGSNEGFVSPASISRKTHPPSPKEMCFIESWQVLSCHYSLCGPHQSSLTSLLGFDDGAVSVVSHLGKIVRSMQNRAFWLYLLDQKGCEKAGRNVPKLIEVLLKDLAWQIYFPRLRDFSLLVGQIHTTYVGIACI